MFFDQSGGNQDFSAQLVQLARLAGTLLELRYDREERRPKPLGVKKTGLFRRELVYPDGYRQILDLLREKADALEKEREEAGYYREMFWWNQNWEELLPLVLDSLTFPQEEETPDEGGWRRAFKIHSLAGREDRQLLALEMRGHWQKITGRRQRSQEEHSPYTQAERQAMVEAYNRKRNDHALLHTAFVNEAGVHSLATGWDYNTAFDYYTSGEYLSSRLRDSENYSQSLYTLEERNILHVSSESKDGGGLYGLCEYHLDRQGRLDSMVSLDFARLKAWGEPEEGEAYFASRDALILSALALGELPQVKRVPLSLFPPITGEESFLQLVRQAGMMACLASKLERS